MLPACVRATLESILTAAAASATAAGGGGARGAPSTSEEFLLSGYYESLDSLGEPATRGRSSAARLPGLPRHISPGILACRVAVVLGFCPHHVALPVILELLEKQGSGDKPEGPSTIAVGGSQLPVATQGGGVKSKQRGQAAAAAVAGSKGGTALVLHLLRAMHLGSVPSLVAACCLLLSPESNQPLDVRLQAIAGEQRIAQEVGEVQG